MALESLDVESGSGVDIARGEVRLGRARLAWNDGRARDERTRALGKYRVYYICALGKYRVYYTYVYIRTNEGDA